VGINFIDIIDMSRYIYISEEYYGSEGVPK
jgi:hypothetical protein